MLGVERAEVERDQLRHARAAAERYDAVVLLKNRHTLVAEPGRAGRGSPRWGRRGWRPPGPGTCSAGSSGRCSRPGSTPFDAASVGSWLHGAAAATAAARRTGHRARGRGRGVPTVCARLLGPLATSEACDGGRMTRHEHPCRRSRARRDRRRPRRGPRQRRDARATRWRRPRVDGRRQGRRLRPRDARGRPRRPRGRRRLARGRGPRGGPRAARRRRHRPGADLAGGARRGLPARGRGRRRRHRLLRRRARRDRAAAPRARARPPGCSSRSTPGWAGRRRPSRTGPTWCAAAAAAGARPARSRVTGRLVPLRLQRRARPPGQRRAGGRRSAEAVERRRAAGLDPEVRHLRELRRRRSPGPSARFDLVRCGLAPYGLSPVPERQHVRRARPGPGDDRAGPARGGQAGAGRVRGLLRAHLRHRARDHARRGPGRVRRRGAAHASSTAPSPRGRPAARPSPAGSAWTSSSSTSATTDARRRRRGRAVRARRRGRADRAGLGRGLRHHLLRDRHPDRRPVRAPARRRARRHRDTGARRRVREGTARAAPAAAVGAAARRGGRRRAWSSAGSRARREAGARRRRRRFGSPARRRRARSTTDDGLAPARRGRRGRAVRRRGAPRTPTRPTVVFVHGFALNLDCWHFQRRRFRGKRRMVFYDQRSHGRSGRSDAGARHDRPARPRPAARSSTQLAPDEPVVLVGHSMGGMSIVALAEQHPELFGDRVVGVGADLHRPPGGLRTHKMLSAATSPTPSAPGRRARPAGRRSQREPGSSSCARRTRLRVGFLVTERVRVRRRPVPAVVRRVRRLDDRRDAVRGARGVHPAVRRCSTSSTSLRRLRDGADRDHVRHQGPAHLDRPRPQDGRADPRRPAGRVRRRRPHGDLGAQGAGQRGPRACSPRPTPTSRLESADRRTGGRRRRADRTLVSGRRHEVGPEARRRGRRGRSTPASAPAAALDPPSTALDETEESSPRALAAHGGLLAHAGGRPGRRAAPRARAATCSACAGSRCTPTPSGTAWPARWCGTPSRSPRAAGSPGCRSPRAPSCRRTVRFWSRARLPRGRPGGHHRSPWPRSCPCEQRGADRRGDPRARRSGSPAVLRAGDLVILTGDLGAGKTTLTQGLGAGLRVRGGVTSPDLRDLPGAPVAGRRPRARARRRLPARRASPSSTTSTSTSPLDDSVTVVEWGEGLAEGLADDRLEVAITRARGDDVRPGTATTPTTSTPARPVHAGRRPLGRFGPRVTALA